ncbi:uncharacterized protein LOC116293532 [Actinia tenebrosa]|uniref:Uncharacterized protein LOC116293532 n=1 Tax=Actinia tenebrosa TaxID=6105 RepID=A0A6P8HP57_ACTTE|nr:uncharacterized protein LOC116293532 [Actinia tenebrosa]
MKKFELAMQTGLVPKPSDTGKDITLRNASEHKRLEGHLKHLDHQLRSKLVSMQAEIMELKASQYGLVKKEKKRSLRLLESRDRANSEGRLHQRRGRPRTLTTDQLPNGPSVHMSTTNIPDQKADSQNELVLPEINIKQSSLVGNTTRSSASDRNSFPSDSSKKKKKHGGLSPVDNDLLNIPSPSSIYRPNSLPDLSRLGSNSHGVGGVSPRSARRVKFTLPVSKPGQSDNAMSTDNYKEPVKENAAPSEPQNTLAERINDFINQKETTTENLESPAIEVTEVGGNDTQDANTNVNENDVFYNSMLAKASMENGLESAPDLASLGFMDFNDVIDKRLKQTQEELPSEDEMRKVRYLRWRHEVPQLDLVKTVFEKGKDLDIDGLNAQDLNVNDSEPRFRSDNDKDNQLKSSES